MSTITMKFGGTSVGSVASIETAIDIIQEAYTDGHRVVVVSSAMGGVTDMLIEGGRAAAAGEATRYPILAQELWAKHEAIIRELVTSDQMAVYDHVFALVDEFEALCYALAVLGEEAPRVMAKVHSLGERMIVPILAALLSQLGVRAHAVSAADLIVTDDAYLEANVDLDATLARTRRQLVPMLQQNTVPVVTGFLGATPAGHITLLGRNGSDYSAALVGAGVDCDEVWIWTDVNGIMTADPRLVPDAHVLPALSYGEVSEMAYFGAKVVHARTMQPLLERNIPIRVKNTFAVDQPGTLISHEEPPQAIRAVTTIRNSSLLRVKGRGVVGHPGISARVYGMVAGYQNALMISQSPRQQTIGFVVPRDRSETIAAAVELALGPEMARGDIVMVELDHDVEVVAVIGTGLLEATSRIVATLAGIDIIAVAQGAGDHCLPLVIHARDVASAVGRLHTLVSAPTAKAMV